MPKWNIASYANATTSFVTFTASTSVAAYKIFGYSFGKNAVLPYSCFLSMSNIKDDDGTTITMFFGETTTTGSVCVFPGDGFMMDARNNGFVTLTANAAATGTLAVAYEIVAKQP